MRPSILVLLLVVLACAPSPEPPASSGDSLLLTGARVYTFAWPEPEIDGTPSTAAPVRDGVWTPDAEAVLLRDGLVEWVGSGADADAEQKRAEVDRVLDLDGAVVLPGLVDAHTHIRGLGANLRRVDLVGVSTEAEAIARVREQRPDVAPGQWIVGWGWDDGAWAADYPDWNALSEAYPDHPVVLLSLHSFAIWGNRAAFAAAGIDAQTEAPVGGEIVRDGNGEPTGILLNRATTLLTSAIPPPTADELRAEIVAGLEEMARSGYVAVHEAGLDAVTLQAFADLEETGELPVRVYAMLSARDEGLMERYIATGPDCEPDRMLRICSVKAYWDGALGSRGARLLEDYSDLPGHRGVSGEGYGFDQELVRRSIEAGFQVGVHAIGDAGNRETLDFLESVLSGSPAARSLRHRIEHAQVVHPSDVPRFSRLGLIASMQPPHMAEDRAWAEDRLGSERVRGAYAWRTLRESGAGLVFSSDLAGSDHDIFYGLHSAVARRSRDGSPTRGWYPEQALTLEETLRAYTGWAATASFLEDRTGVLEPGRFADLTVLADDPFEIEARDPFELLDGRVLMTITGGRIVYDGR